MREILRSYGGLTVEPVGFRPGMGICKNPPLQEALIHAAEAAIQAECGQTPLRKSASTDCNIPYSMGIPALCFGLVVAEGAHTREEWVDLASLPQGLKIALNFMKRILS